VAPVHFVLSAWCLLCPLYFVLCPWYDEPGSLRTETRERNIFAKTTILCACTGTAHG